jgi:hypothetical protein
VGKVREVTNIRGGGGGNYEKVNAVGRVMLPFGHAGSGVVGVVVRCDSGMSGLRGTLGQANKVGGGVLLIQGEGLGKRIQRLL